MYNWHEVEGSGRRFWHRFTSEGEGIKYPVPSHWPANNPLPPNYYPKDPPPGYVSQLIPKEKGAKGIAGIGLGIGTASPRAHRP